MTGKIIVRKETHKINILMRPAVPEKRFCDRCQREMRWLVPEEVMLLTRISLCEVFRLVETGKLHFAENAEVFLIVCAQSLMSE